ncbi:uncharacterized protein LOC134297079 [Anolis carolinensis]|uniref:uncharacterized protein LOC134297079 n=1 Tax=Anolis carolinensis TaxID=28377 RepID=UPI002F2B8FAF
MAAKQQRMRKSQAAKRKRLQKKSQLAKRGQKRLRGARQRKSLPCPEPKDKPMGTVSSKVVRIRTPKLFASKIVRQVLKSYIEVKAKGLVKTLLTDVYNHVSTQVESLSQRSQPSPISTKDVQKALEEAMAKELGNQAAVEPVSSECA